MPVENLYYFRLKIANTGKKTIQNQAFSCFFPEKSHTIDPSFPKITCEPPIVEVKQERQTTVDNRYRYIIRKIGTGHTVSIEFLVTTEQPSTQFRVVPEPNDEQEVSFKEGDPLRDTALEEHLVRVFIGLVGFIVTTIIFSFPTTPIVGDSLGAILGIPFVLYALRSIYPIASALAKKLQSQSETRGLDYSQYAEGSYIAQAIDGGSASVNYLYYLDLYREAQSRLSPLDLRAIATNLNTLADFQEQKILSDGNSPNLD